MKYTEMSRPELLAEKAILEKQYEDYKARGLRLDLSRGKPGKDQLDLLTDYEKEEAEEKKLEEELVKEKKAQEAMLKIKKKEI